MVAMKEGRRGRRRCSAVVLGTAAAALCAVSHSGRLAFTFVEPSLRSKVDCLGRAQTSNVLRRNWAVDSMYGWAEELAEDPVDSAASALSMEGTTVETALQTLENWLSFIKAETGRGTAERLADATGYPLELALELFTKELPMRAHMQGAEVITMKLPDDAPRGLGPVGLVAAIRRGEELDLSFLGGREWQTIHLDFLATNPLIHWASEVFSSDLAARLQAATSGSEMLRRLLSLAAEAGHAVTVSPIDDAIKEQYRRMGFQEDDLLDPTLMFWIPTEEVLESLRLQTRPLAYGAS